MSITVRERFGRCSLVLTVTSLCALFSSPVVAQGECDDTPSCVMDLRSVLGDIDPSTDPHIGTLLAQSAVRMDQAMDIGIETEGQGPYYGNRYYGDKPEELMALDCTEYLIEILRRGFEAAGHAELIDSIIKLAVKNSGKEGLKGIVLMKTLQDELGWEGIYFNPDVEHPGDSDDEHPYTAYIAGAKGTYYGLNVNKDRSLLDYNPSSTTDHQSNITTSNGTELNTDAIEQAGDIPFGLVAARGGRHMAVIVDGDIYEVHWSKGATSPDLITAVPLEEWGWMSGVILAPPAGEE
jgi:hypothetical protein